MKTDNRKCHSDLLRHRQVARAALICAVSGLFLAGCAHTADAAKSKARVKPEIKVSPAALPTTVVPYPKIEATLSCINSTGALSGKTFIVGPFADSTGKVNSVSAGSTGAFVPQGGSAAYITDALMKAGGRVISTYFGAPAINAPAQYMVNGIFNSLDFSAPFAADVRVAGIGPIVQRGWAQLTLTIQLDEAGTRLNRQLGLIQRPVHYQQLALGIGTVAGNTLVTGAVATQDQQRLQFEAINGPIALGVIDVLLKEFPTARPKCAGEIADLLGADANYGEDGTRFNKPQTATNLSSDVAAAPEKKPVSYVQPENPPSDQRLLPASFSVASVPSANRRNGQPVKDDRSVSEGRTASTISGVGRSVNAGTRTVLNRNPSRRGPEDVAIKSSKNSTAQISGPIKNNSRPTIALGYQLASGSTRLNNTTQIDSGSQDAQAHPEYGQYRVQFAAFSDEKRIGEVSDNIKRIYKKSFPSLQISILRAGGRFPYRAASNVMPAKDAYAVCLKIIALKRECEVRPASIYDGLKSNIQA